MTSWPARPRIIGVLLGIVAVGVALALIGWLVLPNLGGGDDDSAERNQVTSRATDFAVAYNTYDVADLADYQKRLKGLLAPEYDEQFVEITNAVFGALESKKQKSGGAKVLGVAIDSIDDDSAVAIVAVDASITNTDNEAAVLRHFRWKVSFTRSDDAWLVSNFESVASVEAQAGEGETAPDATEPTSSTDAEEDDGR